MIEAEQQFQLALALNPKYTSALFNLGLNFQQQDRWDEAIDTYQATLRMATSGDPNVSVLSDKSLMDCKIRQCDLIHSQGRLVVEAQKCWEEGVQLFPHNELMRNELGSILTNVIYIILSYYPLYLLFQSRIYNCSLRRKVSSHMIT